MFHLKRMIMRNYQKEIISAVINRRNWGGCNVVVKNTAMKTEVYYYGNLIATVDHCDKSATYDRCGFNNAATSARINAVVKACDSLGYRSFI